MPKKVIQDMKSKGVKITRISKKEITPEPKKMQVLDTEDYLNKIEGDIKPNKHILRREPEEKIYSTPRVKKRIEELIGELNAADCESTALVALGVVVRVAVGVEVPGVRGVVFVLRPVPAAVDLEVGNDQRSDGFGW